MSERTETREEALARIRSGFSKNDQAVIIAFAEAGIDPDQITPRQNVLTFDAWKAAGRQVAKGATSLRIEVWVPRKGKKTEEDDEKKGGALMRRTARLFHESQTLPKGTPSGTLKPAAWLNPVLIKEGTYSPEDGLPIDGGDGDQPPAAATAEPAPSPTPAPVAVEPEPTPDHFGAHGDARPATCNCPMVGVMTNVACPLHGDAALATV